MAIDWDAELLAPVMAVFGEGMPGVPASWPTYHPDGGAAFQLPDAVFDEAYAHTEIVDDVPISTRNPALGVRASLFVTPPQQGDLVFIPSVEKTFAVANPQPDGHGHVLLILMETDA